MKTIATAAVLMMLAGSAWADDAEKQSNDPANSNEPIVLSEAEMDGVTAGFNSYRGWAYAGYNQDASSSDSTTSSTYQTECYALSESVVAGY